jgi:hypothetical protein
MARCAETIYHPPLLEFYVERPFRRTTPHNGGPHCALWRHRQPPAAPAWRIVTVEDQWARFVEDVSRLEQPVLLPAHFDEWSERYLDADPDSRSREPAGVKTPTGPFTDILHGWHGALAYEPALYRLRSQSFAANGTDSLATTTPDGYSTLSSGSPIKRDIKISPGDTPDASRSDALCPLSREHCLSGDDEGSVPQSARNDLSRRNNKEEDRL